MKITICASVDFTYEIRDVAEQLRSLGHEIVGLPHFTQKILRGEVSYEEYMETKSTKWDISFRQSTDIDFFRRYWDYIEASDAILVLNLPKKGIDDYIGGNAFLEMGFAYILHKTIYLYGTIPTMPYTDEIIDMKPVSLKWDLSLIH